MALQYIIIGLILTCSVSFTIYRLSKRFKGDSDCGCGRGKNCKQRSQRKTDKAKF